MKSSRRAIPLLLLAACARGQNSFSLEKEAALGTQIAAEFRKQAVAVKSDSIQAFAERTVHRLGLYFNSPFPWKVEVVTGLYADPMDEPVSVPGGYIFIRAGLLLNARTEDEFAGMVAHAMAHVARRDSTRAASIAASTQSGRIPLVFIGGWSGAWTRGAMAKALETGADSAAVKVLIDAGYDPRGLVDFIARVSLPTQTQSRRFRIAMPESRLSSARPENSRRQNATPSSAPFRKKCASSRRPKPRDRNPRFSRRIEGVPFSFTCLRSGIDTIAASHLCEAAPPTFSGRTDRPLPKPALPVRSIQLRPCVPPGRHTAAGHPGAGV